MIQNIMMFHKIFYSEVYHKFSKKIIDKRKKKQIKILKINYKK